MKDIRPSKIKLTRSERNMVVKQRLFDAAVTIVGEVGYSEASVARITQLAGTSQGAFYNHFESRQALLDELLPRVGQNLLAFIQRRTEVDAESPEKEVLRFLAFFDFLKSTPEFLRILNEAEMYAPVGYKQHMETISAAYVRILIRARDRDELNGFSDAEIEVIVHILMGARGYLSSVYAYCDRNQVREIPEHVVTAYERLIRNGLFKQPAPATGTADRAADVKQPDRQMGEKV